MDIRDIILLVSAAFNATLAGVIVFHNPKSRSNILYSLAALGAALWAIGIAFFRLSDFPAALSIARFYYVAAALIAAFFLRFAIVFPEEAAKPWPLLRYILFYLPIGFIIFLLLGRSFLESYAAGPDGKIIHLGPGYLFYIVYFVSYVGAAFWILIRKFRQAVGVARAQLWFVMAGVGIAMAIGMWFNLFLPFAGNYQLIWVGPPFTMVMVGFIAYAIFKHNLYNIKVIATEAFGTVLALVLLIRLFASVSATEVILNALILGVASVIVFLLIRSVLKEVEQREKIQSLATELSAANEELKRLDAAKSEFISIAGHQLRAPLTVIKGYVSLLLEGTLGDASEKVKDSMKKVYFSAEQLVRLIADLLDLSRIEAGRLRYEFRRVMMDDIVAEAVRELEVNAKAKGLAFSYENRNTAKRSVNADIDKMREVVLNLIDNAIKYTAVGRVNVTLYPEVRKGREWLMFKVEDTGLGIRSADIPRLFTKFARTEEAKRVQAEGMGLGLYIVKRIVEDHGGKCWVESPGLGHGSTFYAALPTAA
ncbi:MAG: hypothetical protein HY473_00605 [Candidatus Sungbacteria bacterium]|uniref:histidine kinase n=1 Tax=Candidatus Sungiibacteriota bacterium TaxID=2750080 RepID=A0A932YWF0_9BACT|nr:hypothetical protein [Candidatus Sungbacteria bacterium]